jgi:hypothetical protein
MTCCPASWRLECCQPVHNASNVREHVECHDAELWGVCVCVFMCASFHLTGCAGWQRCYVAVLQSVIFLPCQVLSRDSFQTFTYILLFVP